MDKRTSFTTTPSQSASLAPQRLTYRSPRTRSTLLLSLIACLIGAALLLAACGPAQPKVDSAQLADDTLRIAQEYAVGGSLDQARTAINALQVANPHQYLVIRTEEAIGSNADPQATAALVKLALALNLNTGSIHTYAAQNNLLPAAAEVAAAAVAAVEPAATPTVAPAPASVVAATATPAPVAAAAAVTATDAVTTTSTTAATDTGASSTPAAAADTSPRIVSDGLINVRGGPGVEYPVVDALQTGQNAPITGKSPAGDWWEITLPSGQVGWVLGQLVEPEGDTNSVAVAANIPTPPPTEAPAVAVAATEAATAAPAAPAADAGATVTPTTAAASPNDAPFFKLIASRMWSKAENGDCRGQHLLRINVIDANGVRINGVRLKGLYTGEEIVTGSQGKGDGVIEYDLYGSGEGFSVIQNNDGRPATSDRAEGYTTNSRDISVPTLIEGGYCADDATCQIFYDSWGCKGHHSWEATFQRNY